MALAYAFKKLFHEQPQLFCDPFDYARWMFLRLVGGNQWIWVAVDLANKEIQLYNSLNNSTNMRYLKMHLHTLVWLKYFLAWRLGEHNLLFL